MKMFLTRIGFGSKVIVTGDSSQKDLPVGAKSGLDVAARVLKNIDDIAFCNLTNKDVVRHPLVQKIVKAYDDYEARTKLKIKTTSAFFTAGDFYRDRGKHGSICYGYFRQTALR